MLGDLADCSSPEAEVHEAALDADGEEGVLGDLADCSSPEAEVHEAALASGSGAAPGGSRCTRGRGAGAASTWNERDRRTARTRVVNSGISTESSVTGDGLSGNRIPWNF